MQPPPAGSSPTPVSTRPMYSSAWAWRRAACSAISAPPPRQNPNGATTTGRGQNLMACGHALEGADGEIDLVPLAFLRAQQQLHQVGADGEVARRRR